MPQKTNVKYVDADGVVNPVTGGVGQAVDGQTIVAGDAVLLVHPPNGDAYAGPWIAATGAWSRATDWDVPADITLGDEWYVEDGAEYTGTKWHFDDDAVPTSLNTDLLTISQLTRRRALEQGSGISISGTTPPLITWTAPSDVENTFIEGLRVEYLTANSLRIGNGACFIPTSGVVNADTDIDITGMTLTASTWYYLYAYDAGGGVLAVEYSNVAPVTTPYRGAARAKGPDVGSDLTRRYIGAVYASATNTIRRFSRMSGSFTKWVVSQDGATRVVNGATNTTTASVDISAVCPPTARGVDASGWLNNANGATTLFITASGDGLQTVGTASGAGQLIVGPHNAANAVRMMNSGPIALAGLQALHYYQSDTGASRLHHVDVRGYYEER